MTKIRANRIIEGAVKSVGSVITGNKKEFVKERQKVCKRCDNNKKGFCNICGCNISAKTQVGQECCPENFWNDVQRYDKLGIILRIIDTDLVKLYYTGKGNIMEIEVKEDIPKNKKTEIEVEVINDRANYFDDRKDITLTDFEIKTSCRCTTIVEELPSSLKDGESFKFKVKYNTGIIGSFSKNVKVITDQATFNFKIKGKVVK